MKMVWDKVGVDVIFFPEPSEGCRYAVFARDNLSGWTEGRAITSNDTSSVAQLLFEDIIC